LGQRPPNQAGVADGMMRGAKGAVADQGLVRGNLVGHGVVADRGQASSTVILGRMPGIEWAMRVLPAAGGPVMSMLCPAAAATSNALLTCS
jgi:hypothetical protein